jgi:hypothetical protein
LRVSLPHPATAAAQLKQLRTVNLLYGACTLAAILGGDGVQHTVARVQSAGGPLEVEVTRNPRTGKLTSRRVPRGGVRRIAPVRMTRLPPTVQTAIGCQNVGQPPLSKWATMKMIRVTVA